MITEAKNSLRCTHLQLSLDIQQRSIRKHKTTRRKNKDTDQAKRIQKTDTRNEEQTVVEVYSYR